MRLLSIKKVIVRVIKTLTYSLLVGSVLTKSFCIPYISHKFHLLGIGDFCHFFGIIEFIAIVLFFYEKTLGLGVAFLCCYFGGAIATDFHSPEYLYQPLLVLSMVFITTTLRRPGLFYRPLSICEESGRIIIFFQN